MALTYAQAKEQFMGINPHKTTYDLNSGITATTDEGKLLTITDIGEAGVGSSGDNVLGVLAKYESDGTGSIQDGGYVEITIAHDATLANEVTVGKWVQCNGAGLGALSTTNKGAIAVAVDATNHKAIIKIA